jgi:hypothetical protein
VLHTRARFAPDRAQLAAELRPTPLFVKATFTA